MRVGIFSDDFYPILGGMGSHVYDLSNQIKKFPDMKIFIFSSAKNKIKNHTTLNPGSRKFGKNILLSIYINLILPGLVNKYSLDLVHIHSGNGGIFLLRKLKVPCIVTAHTNTYLRHYQDLRKISKLILFPLEKITYNYAKKIIAVSSFIKEDVIKNYGLIKEKIIVIPNGIDTKIFKKSKKIKKIENSLLFVGRIEKRKGLEFLIKTLPKIKEEISDIKLFVLGKGPDEEKIKKLTKKLNLEKNVVFKGFLNKKEVVRYYNLCNICIVPSIVEGFGLNVLEALSCDIKVISTRKVGAIEYYKNSENLFVVDYSDSEELAKKVISILKNKKLPHKKGVFKKISEKYSLEKIAKKTKEVYQNEVK